MRAREAHELLSSHTHRLARLVSLLLIIVVALRRRYDLVEPFSAELLIIIIGLFTILFASEPWLSRKLKAYKWIYFALQIILVQCVGIFRDYQDTWAMLYIALGFQVANRCTRKEAYAWFGLLGASLFTTLAAEFGLISGPGRALAYGVIGTLVLSYDIQYSRHEEALGESQVLVAELREANQKLAEYAAQAEELAAVQERNRMVQELYDAVGQKVFAIQLAAETARIMLDRDAQQAASQLADLQRQTQSTLSQMRQLIEQWRPG